MQTVSCPSCGAPLAFKSHAAVMAVCEFCRATVVKDADAVKDIGKMSAVLEDYSPIQIGTSGTAGNRQFSVIGRIQLRYSQGLWNEWYLLFDDGAAGWLGDSSGMYVLTTERAATAPLPAFDDIQVGKLVTIEGQRYTAAEKRSAQCIGGQGELPFKVGEGWQARVADLRAGARFATVDYSDEAPVLYDGVAVTLESMKCQLLRDTDAIKATSGRYRGKLDTLGCPSCGTMIKYIPGVTTTLVCQSCRSQLDASSSQAQVIEAGKKAAKLNFSLPLGATANIMGTSRSVIGALIRADDEGAEWTEYLLYGPRVGFMWLIEADDAWYRSSVLETWPEWHWTGSDKAKLDNTRYTKTLEYPAVVKVAVGAFNWRVAAGDSVRVFEFESGTQTLAAEISGEEMTWSRSTTVARDQVASWFGTSAPALQSGRQTARQPTPSTGSTSDAPSIHAKFMWWIIGLNFIPLMANFVETAFIIVVALVALFVPPEMFADD